MCSTHHQDQCLPYNSPASPYLKWQYSTFWSKFFRFRINGCAFSFFSLKENCKNAMYPLTQVHRTQLEMPNMEKLINQKLFLLFK